MGLCTFQDIFMLAVLFDTHRNPGRMGKKEG